MAANAFHRILSILAHEYITKPLANSPSFQRFAWKTTEVWRPTCPRVRAGLMEEGGLEGAGRDLQKVTTTAVKGAETAKETLQSAKQRIQEQETVQDAGRRAGVFWKTFKSEVERGWENSQRRR